ncbi:pyridoxamine 5'-phosphate oxidase family protein [Actinomadura sp. KC216]|uniref:pyridoxamine 5'-phosphate oxidase family protein n=1 Tax=Actinomadura sp. KC216 TaxID=2530370 RepID=UPI001053781E|nr:pyridoxamine 5'-phosphate oxidase family protein [Actinomadura sp. KC216]TDB77097.1 pyridoxamine 5'-phosphate oxidase family protein [Actinomadura sp. KC216]
MAEREPEPEPVAERLSSPSGSPLTSLTWLDARTRIAEGEDYLVATSGPNGRVHVVPVLAVWLDGAVCFNTGRDARKARYLAHNDSCAVTVPGPDVDLVVEGTAHIMRDAGRLQRVAELFPTKYPWWHPFVQDGEFHAPGDADPRHVFAVKPAVVFAFGKEKGFSATRWRF